MDASGGCVCGLTPCLCGEATPVLARSLRPEPPKTCRADACTAEVNPALIFCTRHWAKVPKVMQTAIWQSYTPGQEYVTTPTPEHLDAVRSAVRIIAESEAPRLL